jgi:hypothetical protein
MMNHESERDLNEIVGSIMVCLLQTFPTLNSSRGQERQDLLRTRIANSVRDAYRLGRKHEAASRLEDYLPDEKQASG